MSNGDPQGNTGYISELDVRIWLRDTDPEANLLLDDFEFTPEELRTAMTLAVDKWNETPPMLGNYEVHTFPFRGALTKATAANLLFIAANRYRRNALKYNVPGGAVADLDKHQEYDAAGDRLWKEYAAWIQHMKRAINMETGWGMISGGLRRTY